MTYNVSSGTLNLTHSLCHSLITSFLGHSQLVEKFQSPENPQLLASLLDTNARIQKQIAPLFGGGKKAISLNMARHPCSREVYM